MIKKSLLRPGDLLLYRMTIKSGISSWFIGWGQNVIGKSPVHGKSYVHVAIVDKDTDYMLESRWPRSKRCKIKWKKLDKKYKIELWRVRATSLEKIDKVMEWAYANLGLWYDLGLFIWGWLDFKHAEVCSTFVKKAWGNADVVFKLHKKLTEKGALITPDEIVGSNLDILKRIA